jgi:mannose-6-phosphate isomerase-like protein (cupin superfamily)
MKVESSLRVYNESEVKSTKGVTKGQTIKPLIGYPDKPSERIRVLRASYEPNSLEQLHWHPIEAFYFVISGHAIVRDVEDNSYNVGPGTVIYAPAGFAGAHEWEVAEELELIAVQATTDLSRKMQFTVDKTTMESKITLEELVERRGGVNIKSLY